MRIDGLTYAVINLSTPLSRIVANFTGAERENGVQGIESEFEDCFRELRAVSTSERMLEQLALLYRALKRKTCEYKQDKDYRATYLVLRAKLLAWAADAKSEEGEAMLPYLLMALDKADKLWEEMR